MLQTRLYNRHQSNKIGECVKVKAKDKMQTVKMFLWYRQKTYAKKTAKCLKICKQHFILTHDCQKWKSFAT